MKKRSMPTRSGVFWMSVSAAFVAGLVVITVPFVLFHWSWNIYGGLIGAIFGFLIGLVVIVKVPVKAQLTAAGAFIGMGVDGLSGVAKPGGPTTAINALASFVAKTTEAIIGAAVTTGLPSPLELPVTIGLWFFVAVLAIVMLFGSLQKGAT